MNKWNGKRFSIYDKEEKQVLGLLNNLGEQTNFNTDEIERLTISDNKKVSHEEMKNKYKIDENANFTGSWFGIKKPTQSNEGLSSTVEQIIDETIPGINSQLEQMNDFNKYPQGTKPSKSGVQKNSFKIIKKMKENQLIVIQPTNKGCVKYTMERHNGASQEGRDYGINHELLRIVKVEHIQETYVYFDISSPNEGAFTNPPLYEPSIRNTLEQLLYYLPNYSDVTTFSSKDNNTGVGAYKLYYGNSVSYNIPITMKEKCNLLFLGTTTSSQKIQIKVNDIVVKEFNPRAFTIGTSNGVGIVDFEVPKKSTTNTEFKVSISNVDTTGYFYPCAINFKTLSDYDGEYISDFKCFGSNSNGWITNNGASDYALFDGDKKLWLGSYHGGEILKQEQISWGIQKVEENSYYLTNSTLANIELNDWRVQKNLKIYQQTDLGNNNGKMISVLSFNNDGTLDMDFSYYDGKLNLSTFYTALTCTDVGFRYIFNPIYKNLGSSPTNTFINLPLSYGYVSQVNPESGLQLDIRFTKFNNSQDTRGCVVADNDAYRKLYYGLIYGKKYLIENLSFSKSLDFIVR